MTWRKKSWVNSLVCRILPDKNSTFECALVEFREICFLFILFLINGFQQEDQAINGTVLSSYVRFPSSLLYQVISKRLALSERDHRSLVRTQPLSVRHGELSIAARGPVRQSQRGGDKSSGQAFGSWLEDDGAVSRKHGNGPVRHGMFLGSGKEVLADQRRVLYPGLYRQIRIIRGGGTKISSSPLNLSMI